MRLNILLLAAVLFSGLSAHAQRSFKKPDTRRYFDNGFEHYRLGQFYARPGKPDSVGMVTSIPGCKYFSEPIEKDGWMFSITHADSTNKRGLIAWPKHQWMIRPVEPTYDSIWTGSAKKPAFFGSKNGKVTMITLTVTPERRELVERQLP